MTVSCHSRLYRRRVPNSIKLDRRRPRVWSRSPFWLPAVRLPSGQISGIVGLGVPEVDLIDNREQGHLKQDCLEPASGNPNLQPVFRRGGFGSTVDLDMLQG